MTGPHRILGTFDIKASAAALRPDELMLDWTLLPAGAQARIYLPSVSAAAIIREAGSLYGSHLFTSTDANTLACAAHGIAYLPIPHAGGNIAGLIDVALPATTKPGQKFAILVRQLATVQAEIRPRTAPVAGAPRARPQQLSWRKVVGDFQLALMLTGRAQSLHGYENNLALLRWIFAAIPSGDRWHPVFVRYLQTLAALVDGLGGNAKSILPSATGSLPVDHPPAQLIGKIAGLIYDHFGDFEGFLLETEAGSRQHFYSRESRLADIVARAWAERLRVTIVPQAENPTRLGRIILHPP